MRREGGVNGAVKAPPSGVTALMGPVGDKVLGLRYIIDKEQKDAARLARESERQTRAARRRARRQRQPRLPIGRGPGGEVAASGEHAGNTGARSARDERRCGGIFCAAAATARKKSDMPTHSTGLAHV